MRIAVAPEGTPSWVEEAVRRGGGDVAPIGQAEALVWFGGASSAFEDTLARGGRIRWVQLSTAGIESFARLVALTAGSGRVPRDRSPGPSRSRPSR